MALIRCPHCAGRGVLMVESTGSYGTDSRGRFYSPTCIDCAGTGERCDNCLLPARKCGCLREEPCRSCGKWPEACRCYLRRDDDE
jgi:hypothetical protein